MTDILHALRGGDLRSIGRANEIALEVEKKPSLFKKVFKGLYDNDPIVRMRTADVIEKVTRNKPEFLSDYVSPIISLLKSVDQQEVCWHLAQIAPRLNYSAKEEDQIILILKQYLLHKSKIVRVSALESLAIFAERNSLRMQEVIKIIKLNIESGSPAVQSRARNLLLRLEKVPLNDIT